MSKLSKIKANNKMLNFDYNFNIFHLMKLIARNYFKNYGAVFSDYVLPVIVMTLLFITLDKDFVRTMLPGIIIAPLISTGVISFAMGLFQWRNSIIFKKIKISQISTFQFFLSFFIFYFLASLLSFVFTFFVAVVLKLIGLESLEYFFDDLKLINWGIAISALLLLIAISISLGIIIAFFVTNFNAIIGFGLTIFLVSAFLLGCYLSLSMVVKNEYMYKISWFSPFYSPIRIFQINWLKSTEYYIDSGTEKVPILRDGNNQMIFLENLNLNLDLNNEETTNKIRDWLYSYDRQNQLTLDLDLEQKLSPVISKLTSKEWTIDWDTNSWSIKLTENFKVLSFKADLRGSPSLIQYHSVHFHESYWSMFLLGLAWMVTFGGIISLLNFYKKK